ncbi:antitoxin CptB [Poseidonocella pacifica]|uniref:FAD assembly factor SdhE n=1 Tax=Poseidonocella pacifica TaxID=871651 RepID=A0A1I0VWC5_9RHOB|nr:succinate dehydrogenase assembly factor 2 [Poseidonocella pacifica]SFA79976.1 antitoxin CptB [Poseidonocella pacifica]
MTTESREIRLKRLRMRSMRRGIKEMDIILSTWATARLAELDDPSLDLYEALLTENDHDLYRWVAGQDTAPKRYTALIDDIAASTPA